jgi:hypothetical protein
MNSDCFESRRSGVNKINVEKPYWAGNTNEGVGRRLCSRGVSSIDLCELVIKIAEEMPPGLRSTM